MQSDTPSSYDHLAGEELDVADHPDNQNIQMAANSPGENTKYTVFNKSTNKTTYHDTRNGAYRASDNQDNKYGGYITRVEPYPKLVDPR